MASVNDDPQNKQPEVPKPGYPSRFWFVLAALLMTLFWLRMWAPDQSQDNIRYDELLRFVREGRIDWLEIHGEEIRGGYAKGKRPAARVVDGKTIERPELFTTPRIEDESLVPLLSEHRVAFRGVNDSAWSSQWFGSSTSG